jgi:hypothetical protein
MKLAIVGSRTFTSYEYIVNKIVKYVKKEEIEEIVSGGAEGVDALAERLALEWNIPLTVFKPKLEEYKIKGNKIYYERNELIAQHADVCFAVWKDHSPGTKMTIDAFKRLGKPVHVMEVYSLRD